MELNVFYIIDTNDDELITYTDASKVAAFLLGRHINDYIIIKSGQNGQNTHYKPTSADVFVIEKELEDL